MLIKILKVIFHFSFIIVTSTYIPHNPFVYMPWFFYTFCLGWALGGELLVEWR